VATYDAWRALSASTSTHVYGIYLYELYAYGVCDFPFFMLFEVFRITPFWVAGFPVNTVISIRIVKTNGFIESYDRALFNFGEDDLIDIALCHNWCRAARQPEHR
jgi:hypothetical protein